MSERIFLLGGAALFVISTIFPVAASAVDADQLPGWVGMADVAIAVALVAVGMLIVSRKPGGFAAPVVATAFRSSERSRTSFCSCSYSSWSRARYSAGTFCFRAWPGERGS